MDGSAMRSRGAKSMQQHSTSSSGCKSFGQPPISARPAHWPIDVSLAVACPCARALCTRTSTSTSGSAPVRHAVYSIAECIVHCGCPQLSARASTRIATVPGFARCCVPRIYHPRSRSRSLRSRFQPGACCTNLGRTPVLRAASRIVRMCILRPPASTNGHVHRHPFAYHSCQCHQSPQPRPAS